MDSKIFKIGFSLGRCIRDIVNKKVALDQVVVITSRTIIAQKDQIARTIHHYMLRENYLLGLDFDQCLAVAFELWDLGLLHQPRRYGILVQAVPEQFVWMSLIPDDHFEDPIVNSILQQYLLSIKLIYGDNQAQQAILSIPRLFK